MAFYLGSGVVNLLCLLLAFPLAFYIARLARRKTLLITLVALPFWTSMLIRTYAWMFLLRDTGLINTVLLTMGVIQQPLPLLFNNGAVILGLVYTYLPFMIFPLYATLEKLDFTLLDAAEDLGARPLSAAWRIASSAGKTGHHRRMPIGLYSLPGRLSDSRLDGRRQIDAVRQSGGKSIRRGARLAIWFRDRVRILSNCAGRKPVAPKTRRGIVVNRSLPIYASLLYAFLYLPLLVLTIFSFNSSQVGHVARLLIAVVRAIIWRPAAVGCNDQQFDHCSVCNRHCYGDRNRSGLWFMEASGLRIDQLAFIFRW